MDLNLMRILAPYLQPLSTHAIRGVQAGAHQGNINRGFLEQQRQFGERQGYLGEQLSERQRQFDVRAPFREATTQQAQEVANQLQTQRKLFETLGLGGTEQSFREPKTTEQTLELLQHPYAEAYLGSTPQEPEEKEETFPVDMTMFGYGQLGEKDLTVKNIIDLIKAVTKKKGETKPLTPSQQRDQLNLNIAKKYIKGEATPEEIEVAKLNPDFKLLLDTFALIMKNNFEIDPDEAIEEAAKIVNKIKKTTAPTSKVQSSDPDQLGVNRDLLFQ